MPGNLRASVQQIVQLYALPLCNLLSQDRNRFVVPTGIWGHYRLEILRRYALEVLQWMIMRLF
jgi:hypothetical protein